MVCLAVDLSKDKYSIYSYKMDTLSDRRRSAMIVSEAKKIGMQIQIARKKRKLSLADLAQMVDLTPKYLSMIECGTKTPKLETLISIANALETDANSLLAGVLNTSSVVESAFFSDVIDKYQELSKRQQEKVLRLLNALITEELHEN